MRSIYEQVLRDLKEALPHMRRRSNKTIRYIRRHWRLLVLWGAGGSFVFLGLLALWAATLSLPDLASLQNRKIQQSVKLYDRTGTTVLYDLNKDVERTVVSLDQISPHIQNATLAIEDPTFYEHRGIQPLAILRALWIDLSTLQISQGGSTITQQVVKTSVLTGAKTVTRKFKEWVLALKIERTLTKNQILELYLNQAPYGGQLYGAEAASQAFFGKSASDVTLPEAAYLAAVLPAPTYYSPFGNHRDDLDWRKNVVLDKMYEHGYVAAEERDAAKTAHVEFLTPHASSITAPHFVFYVQQYLEEKYGEDVLLQGGWKVITTLDADLQVKAQETVHKYALENTEKFNASNGGLVAIDPKNGHILVMVGSRNYFDDQIPGNFNVTLAKRQPGSTFKPFAYAKALEKGYTPDTVVFDVRTQFSTACSAYTFNSDGECYSPVDYDNKFRGPMTLRNALAQSINIPAVKVLYLAGLKDTLTLAKSMGITTLGDPGRYGLTLVLGGGEVTLLEMTSAYGTFAQNGMHYNPTAILRLEDGAGNIIEDNAQPGGEQVLPRDVAEKINDILSDQVARAPLGLGSIGSFPRRDVALKTGTTNDYRDAWVIGYTPNLVVGAWAGNNDNSEMAHRVGGLIVAPFWSEFLRYALDKIPPESFSRSEYDYGSLKPALRGYWQVPGYDGSIHEILYWVDKNDPTGPAPGNPASDPQFERWDAPVRAWVAQHGVPTTQPLYVQPETQPTPMQPAAPFTSPSGGAIIPR